MVTLIKLSLLLMLAALISARDDRDLQYDLIVNPFKCRPGVRYKLDCNTCRCGPDPNDKGACTRMGCIIDPDKCYPGSYFEVNGQLCKCPNCGYKWHSDCFASNFCLS